MRGNEIIFHPYQYEEIEKYAAIIEDRLNLLRRGGLDKCRNRNDIRLASCLTELTLKTLQIKSKAYWEIKKYAHERIKDPQDVTDLFLTHNMKKLFNAINDDTVGTLSEEIKRVIDEKAQRIAYAEKRIKSMKDDHLFLQLKEKCFKKAKSQMLKTQVLHHKDTTLEKTNTTLKPLSTLRTKDIDDSRKRFSQSVNKPIVMKRLKLVRKPYKPLAIKGKVNYCKRANKLITKFTQYKEAYADIERSYKRAREILRKTSSTGQKKITTDKVIASASNRFKRRHMSYTCRKLYS